MYVFSVIGERSNFSTHTLSIDTRRSRASAHDLSGGSSGIWYVEILISCFLLAEEADAEAGGGLDGVVVEVERVRVVKVMSVSCALRAEKEEREW